MEFLDLDLKLLSYKDIKLKFDTLNIENIIKSEFFEEFKDKLLSDNRKNVNSLGIKLQKEKDKALLEIQRVKKMYEFDKSFGCNKVIAGVDEVGRGPLAGPIVACSVVLNLDVCDEDLILGLNDSKKISESKRNILANIIKEKALSYSIAICDANEIDEKGIARCNNEVFLKSCYSLERNLDLVLSDGYKIKGIDIDNEFVIKGDTKSANIAAASIVAKVYRDNLMKELDEKYPNYYFANNVGYGTKDHVEALKKLGPCEIHRMSFLKNIL